jgi:hypothetical protein
MSWNGPPGDREESTSMKETVGFIGFAREVSESAGL